MKKNKSGLAALMTILVISIAIIIIGCPEGSGGSTGSTITITFNANGGEGTMAPLTRDKGATIQLPMNTFTKEDTAFTGWNEAANGSGKSYNDRQLASFDSDVTLYAQWFEYEKKLLIFEVMGAADARSVNRNFIQLYNSTEASINLSAYSVYWANGTTNAETPDTAWTRIALTGSIPAKGSFLIVGPKHESGFVANTLIIEDADADMVLGALTLNNRAVKVALLQSTGELSEINPFDTDGEGTKVAGYIDMLGAVNTPGSDFIRGYEEAPARHSNSQAARRKNLSDTDNNAVDFGDTSTELARYAVLNAEEKAAWGPRSSAKGPWDPYAQPEVVITYTAEQVGGTLNTADSTGIEFTFSETISGVTAADISVTGDAEKGASPTFTNTSGNIWLLSPIVVNDQGNAIVTINKSGISVGPRVVSVFMEMGYPTNTFPLKWEFVNDGAASATQWPATTGNIEGTTLEFQYANGVLANLSKFAAGGRTPVNAPNNAGGWYPGTEADPGTITANSSAGWIISMATTGYKDIKISTSHAASNSGPGQFKLAYRLGLSGSWTDFGTLEGFTGMTAGDGLITDNGDSYPIFVDVAMPAAVNNQAIVQVKVYIATTVNRVGATPLQIAGGNTSINNIIFEAVEN